MMRLIDADAFLERNEELADCDFNHPMYGDTLREIVDAEPTAQQWIPVTSRPMDEEERKEWSEKLGYDIEYEEAVIYDSQLPDDEQEILTCDRYGHIRIDTFYNDVDYGCYFEENGYCFAKLV